MVPLNIMFELNNTLYIIRGEIDWSYCIYSDNIYSCDIPKDTKSINNFEYKWNKIKFEITTTNEI